MKKNINLTEAEGKLAILIWQYAPLTSPELVDIADKQMAWKKSTTYTVLKKLCDKGVFNNNNANITVILTQEQLIAHQSNNFVEDTFGGSLPKFVTSFMSVKKISQKQAAELRRIIDEYEESGNDG
jgi:predicted transcriptional regulator